MRILVALAVVKLLHQPGGRVADDEGHGLAELCERVLFRGLIGHIQRVGLGREGHVDHRVRQVHRALGHADEVARLIGRDRDLKRAGVRHAHILAGKAGDAPRDIERVLARLEHAREPVDRSVRIRVAHGFVQGGDQVVVLLAGLVVQQRFFGDALLERIARDRDRAAVCIPVEHDHFERGQRSARVPVCEVCDRLEHIGFDLDFLPAEAARVGERAGEQGSELVRRQRVQHEHLAARQQRTVDLERRVLGRRADQDDAPFLDKGQEGVLLGLVEAVDLIHEHDRALAEAAVVLRLLHDLPDLLDAAGDGGKVDERGLGAVGDDAGERGLAHAGRAPEDHGADAVALDQAAQHLALAQQVGLAGEFLKRLRAQPRRERAGVVPAEQGLLFHHARLLW